MDSVLKFAKQCSHLYDLSPYYYTVLLLISLNKTPEWIVSCRFSVPFSAKCDVHWPHLYGFSPKFYNSYFKKMQ